MGRHSCKRPARGVQLDWARTRRIRPQLCKVNIPYRKRSNPCPGAVDGNVVDRPASFRRLSILSHIPFSASRSCLDKASSASPSAHGR
jgi:hypothetical protein